MRRGRHSGPGTRPETRSCRSDRPYFAEQVERSPQIVEVPEFEVRRADFREWGDGRVRRDPRNQRVLVGFTGEPLLHRLGKQVGEETLGGLGVGRGVDHPARRRC